MVLLQSLTIKMSGVNSWLIYVGIPNTIFISVQTENPKRVHSFRIFLYVPRIVSMTLIAVEVVTKINWFLTCNDVYLFPKLIPLSIRRICLFLFK